MRTTAVYDQDKFTKVHADRRLKSQCVHQIWQKQRKAVMFFSNIYFRFKYVIHQFSLVQTHFLPYNNLFQSLVKIFPDKQDIYTNNVKVIKIDYTRFENSRYLKVANIQVLSGYQGAIEFSIRACISFERNEREWLSFMWVILMAHHHFSTGLSSSTQSKQWQIELFYLGAWCRFLWKMI